MTNDEINCKVHEVMGNSTNGVLCIAPSYTSNPRLFMPLLIEVCKREATVRSPFKAALFLINAMLNQENEIGKFICIAWLEMKEEENYGK